MTGKGPEYDNKYNFGQLLQLAGVALQALLVIAAIIGFWIGLSGRLSGVESQIGTVGILVKELQDTKINVQANTLNLRQTEAVVRDMTTTMRAVLDQLTIIREDIASLKAQGLRLEESR